MLRLCIARSVATLLCIATYPHLRIELFRHVVDFHLLDNNTNNRIILSNVFASVGAHSSVLIIMLGELFYVYIYIYICHSFSYHFLMSNSLFHYHSLTISTIVSGTFQPMLIETEPFRLNPGKNGLQSCTLSPCPVTCSTVGIEMRNDGVVFY